MPGGEAVLSVQTDGVPPEGFSAGAVSGFFTKRLQASDPDELVSVIVTASVDGLGPFQVTSVRPPIVDVLYRGDDRQRAEALDGLEAGDPYQDGGDICGTVSSSRITDVREDVTPLTVP